MTSLTSIAALRAQVVITPTRAVLHRAGASSTAASSACGSDCIALFG